MQLIVSWLLGIVVALVAAAYLWRRYTRRARGIAPYPRPNSSGPANLRFECSGCAGQFTHTRRTLGAWEKGTRRFYCNACHKKWREARPSPVTPLPAAPDRVWSGQSPLPPSNSGRPSATSAQSQPALTTNRATAQSPTSAGSGNGCLGATLLILTVPVVVVGLIAHYAI